VLSGNVDRLFLATADGIIVETLAPGPLVPPPVRVGRGTRVDVSGNELFGE
jgi:hypothetical protein